MVPHIAIDSFFANTQQNSIGFSRMPHIVLEGVVSAFGSETPTPTGEGTIGGLLMNVRYGIFFAVQTAVFSSVVQGCTSQQSKEGIDTDVGGDSDRDAGSDCDASDFFLISAKVSSAIGTVGIVEWSTAVQPTSSPTIEFGLDTNYEYEAPADLDAKNFRTLLLGMKPSSTYHYRINMGGDCVSSDYTIETGPVPTGLPNKTVAVQDAESSALGFIVTSSGMKGNTAFILDKDSDYVWWYSFSEDGICSDGGGISRAKMSGDGHSMWAANLNVGGGAGCLYRIGMDGLGTEETLVVDRHHDFTVLPDNSIAYIEFTNDGDIIVERSPSGATRAIYSLNSDFAGENGDWSHCNAIHYYPSDDTYTVSCLNLNNIIKISRASGNLLWNFAGDGSGDFEGVSWHRQHGHQLLDNGNMLLFNNSSDFGGGTNPADGAAGGIFVATPSMALEFSLDESAGQAALVWSYDGRQSSNVLGDVERLPNGNTLVTYSTPGVIHEVTSSQTLVRSITLERTGYADWRPTLYGAPALY
jgi:hypothetical protein